MKRQELKQGGFHVTGLVIMLFVLGVIGFAGYRVFVANNKKATVANQTNPTSDSSDNGSVKWAFNQEKLEWFAQAGTAPACKDPFTFDMTPVDLSNVMVIGMPGAYRGYNYKPHGLFRLNNSTSGKIEVRLPMDATLVGINRYYEGNPAELQYLLTFESDCGIAFRFDHLYRLTPPFQALAETTAEPKLNDTHTDPNRPFERKKFKAGDVVATEVGFPRIKNYGFDFGVYDYRSRNEISKNKKWAAIHNQYQSFDWYARCWIDMLPGNDAVKAKELSLVVFNPQRPNIISDTCAYAPNNTLDFNGGQPTDG